MTALHLKQISSTNKGILYSVTQYNNGLSSQVTLTIQNTKTLFGLEIRYNKKYFKWVINPAEYKAIRDLEQKLQILFKDYSIDEIRSKIIERPNYPNLLETSIPSMGYCSNDIIKHSPGVITSYSDISKLNRYDILVQLANVSIQTRNSKKILYYNLEIINIKDCVNSI